VEKKIFSQRIHWLEVTFKPASSKKLPESLPQEGKECYPLHGYNAGQSFSDGRMEFIHTSRPDMGCHIQWDGAACDLCVGGTLPLVAFLLSAGAKFTRIDLANDCQNFGLKAEHATREIQEKRFVCRCKKTPCWFDPSFGGWTQYLGTRASEIHLRIYDKAKEMGINADYTRVELVVKGRRASAAAKAIVGGTDYRALVDGYVQFPDWLEWQQIMVADAVSLPAEKKETATDIWLLGQVAKTMARRLNELGDDELWFRFLEQVKANRKT
jgi:DNA relaxase NicK